MVKASTYDEGEEKGEDEEAEGEGEGEEAEEGKIEEEGVVAFVASVWLST